MRALLLGVLLISPVAHADAYMQFVNEEIDGDAGGDRSGWIELTGLSGEAFRIVEWASAGGRTTSPVFGSEMVVSKAADSASARLAIEALRSTNLGLVRVEVTSGPQVVYQLVLGQVAITGLHLETDGTERLTLHYKWMPS